MNLKRDSEGVKRRWLCWRDGGRGGRQGVRVFWGTSMEGEELVWVVMMLKVEVTDDWGGVEERGKEGEECGLGVGACVLERLEFLGVE